MPELRLEVEADPVGLVNLVQNPNGDLGGWGWLTPLAGSQMQGGTNAQLGHLGHGSGTAELVYTGPAGAGPSYFTTEPMPVAAGQYVGARWYFVYGTGGCSYVRVRVEWLNAAGVLISSSVQTGYFGLGTNTMGAVQAPALTVYARLRFDCYSTNAGAQPGGGHLHLKAVTAAKAATSAAIGTVRTNLCRNPSFETGLAGWTGSSTSWSVTTSNPSDAPVAQGTKYARVQLNAGAPTAQAIQWEQLGANAPAVTDGTDVLLSAYVRGGAAVGATVRVWARFYDAGGTDLNPGGWMGSTFPLPAAWTRLGVVLTPPAGAARMDVRLQLQDGGSVPKFLDVDGVLVEQATGVTTAATYFDGSTPDAGGVDYAWSGTAHASASTASQAGLSYIEPVTYQNIIGPTISLQIDRQALDVGTLTGTVREALLDPRTSNDVRPGRRCRLLAKGQADELRPVINTKLIRAAAQYDKRKTDLAGNVRTRITLAGADNVQTLANTPERRGVATVAGLAWLLEGAGVPWNINGSGGQIAAQTLASTNENASLLDQIAVARDTNRAHAYVDARNVLMVTNAPAASGVVLADDDEPSYTSIDAGFSTDECINSVKIVWLRYDSMTDKTEQVQYGPYEDQTSIDTWGVHSRTFTIHGTAAEDPATIAAYANAILAANKTPVAKIRSLTVNVNSEQLVDAVLDAELTKTVLINYAGVQYTARVAGVQHRITAKRWTATFTFDQAATVAQPSVVPRPDDTSEKLPEVIAISGALQANNLIGVATHWTLSTWATQDRIGPLEKGIVWQGGGIWAIDADGAGYWRIDFMLTFGPLGAGTLVAGQITVNNNVKVQENAAADNNHYTSCRLSWEGRLAAGDLIRLNGYQNTGANQNVLAGGVRPGEHTNYSMRRISY
jgi:hypothetical protein